VKVGGVSNIVVRYYTVDRRVVIPVYVDFERRRIERVGAEEADPSTILKLMIDRGLRAQLSMQSFVTGMLAIQLDFYPDTPVQFVGLDPQYPEVPTVASTMEEFRRTLQNLPLEALVNDTQRAVQGVEALVRSPDLQNAIRSLDAALQDYGKLARHADERLGPLVDELASAAVQARSTLKTAEDKISAAQGSLSDTLGEYRRLAETLNGRVEPLVNQFQDAAATAQVALEQARTTLATTEALLTPESQVYHSLVTALNELASAARGLRVLAEYVEQHPESLIQGKNGSGGG
jgi:paraquat-inducible protein B